MSANAGQLLSDRVKALFLEELARTGNVSAAARAADRTRQAFYAHRDVDEAFSEAWEDAIHQATDRLELEARRRAHDGVEEPVFYQGIEVGTVRKYSDTLMIQLLKAHHPAHRNTINHKHAIGGDPDAPPVAGVAAVAQIEPGTLDDDDHDTLIDLAHKALQRGGKR